MRLVIAAAGLGLCLGLGGCLGLVGAGAAIGTVGGSLALANEAAQLAGTVLSDDAKLACALQAYANAKQPPDPQLSYRAGLFCKW